jgi:hypothetical protein
LTKLPQAEALARARRWLKALLSRGERAHTPPAKEQKKTDVEKVK